MTIKTKCLCLPHRPRRLHGAQQEHRCCWLQAAGSPQSVVSTRWQSIIKSGSEADGELMPRRRKRADELQQAHQALAESSGSGKSRAQTTTTTTTTRETEASALQQTMLKRARNATSKQRIKSANSAHQSAAPSLVLMKISLSGKRAGVSLLSLITFNLLILHLLLLPFASANSTPPSPQTIEGKLINKQLFVI